MKSLTNTFASILFIFGLLFILSTCNQQKDQKNMSESKADNVDIAEIWVVTDTNSNKFDITLNKDGTATTTWSVLEKGVWTVVSQRKLKIKWNSGATEFIIIDEHGRGAERRVFGPGKSTEDAPDEITRVNKK